MRVLVVEDEVKMAGLLNRGLEEEGYGVDVAPGGQEAVWLGTENPYDAVVLDVTLPDMDGFEVCRKLRDAGRWSPVQMLLPTALLSEHDRSFKCSLTGIGRGSRE